MKLKYYLRGMGVGIILAAVVIGIASPDEKLSDEEIIRRATALGMVMKDNDEEKLDKIIGEINPSGGEPTNVPSAPAQAESDNESDNDNIDSDNSDNGNIGGDNAAITEVPDENTQAEGTGEADEEKEAEAEEPEQITFTIEGGMSSIKVSKLLKEKGLIDDADDFNQYVVSQGKAHVLRPGTYTLPSNSGYKEILEAIVNR